MEFMDRLLKWLYGEEGLREEEMLGYVGESGGWVNGNRDECGIEELVEMKKGKRGGGEGKELLEEKLVRGRFEKMMGVELEDLVEVEGGGLM